MLNLIKFLYSFTQIKITRNREPNIAWQYMNKLPENVTIKHILKPHMRVVELI